MGRSLGVEQPCRELVAHAAYFLCNEVLLVCNSLFLDINILSEFFLSKSYLMQGQIILILSSDLILNISVFCCFMHKDAVMGGSKIHVCFFKPKTYFRPVVLNLSSATAWKAAMVHLMLKLNIHYIHSNQEMQIP